ncbi:cytochrome c oxidase subunit I [Micromonospora sp. WMMD1082]|uniref:cytochrome c oxidase subunit I n=1 Tax=Micromonospora sp. WMMD1082 TaxID=3016104 RepID=UPI0024167454|nr:cytochrome c oxidase subunit I [Micromonospora sp. WMMD1082]MDG4798227.1 cytochrome c oxidase subunit I [Micromonospora sp. WMMD1082]
MSLTTGLPDAATGDQPGFAALWRNPRGIWGSLSAVSHKPLGGRFMITAGVFFLVGGVEALLMRVQLARPENRFLDAQTYNDLFTMHGTTMMFLFVVPFIEGLANYLLPVQLGARDQPFPRFNAFNYWCYLFGGILLYSSFAAAAVPDAGWFAYVPLSSDPYSPGPGMDFWLWGLALVELSGIGAAVEILVLTLRMRAPGMSLARMPLFGWAMMTASGLILLAFPPLLIATGMLEFDRLLGASFFVVDKGGSALLWQHLFWIFGHPEVYIMFLPAAGIVSQVVQVHARQRLIGYPFVVLAFVLTAVISLGLWVHHMYTTGLPPLTMSFFTAASMTIAIASGIQVLAWVATIWLGRPRFTVAMLFVVGFIVTFVAGGITGVMVASVPFDEQVHDTYFVVAHFHYVLIGGVVFPLLAALYHWLPKMTGRRLHHRAGVLAFALVFVGFHLTFFPMHLAGMWGMVRRVYTYDTDLGIGGVNLLSTVGAFLLATGVLVFVIDLAVAWRRGAPAGPDPWGGDGLEWSVPAPPPPENFARIPQVGGRYPGWQPAADADERTRAFDRAPGGFRATPTTSVLLAEPEATVHLPGPTRWPLVPALGLVATAAALVFQAYPIAVGALVVVAVGFAGWLRRNEAERSPERAGVQIGGLPVDVHGVRSVGWWGAMAAIAVLATAGGTILASYQFLQVTATGWPPALPQRPGAVLPAGLLAALVLAAGGALWLCTRAEIHRRTALVVLTVVAVAGVTAGGLTVGTYVAAPPVPSRHAYDSMVLLVLVFQAALVLVALLATGLACLRSARGGPPGRVRLLIQICAGYWSLTAVWWALAAGSLYTALVG